MEAEAGISLTLSVAQRRLRAEARRFVEERITPHADRWEREETFPRELVSELSEAGFLSAPVPRQNGGPGLDPIGYGLLSAEIGRGCSSIRSMATAHDMSTLAILRWSRPAVRDEVVPRLARGEALAAFALSEPDIGSHASGVETEAEERGDEYILRGRKMWITCGMIADLFLVIARTEAGPVAFLVDGEAPGLERIPIRGMMGTAAAHLAELRFEECRVPTERMIGRPGFGVSAVASTALDLGRYSVAWGAVGVAEACLEAASDHTSHRKQFGVPLREHQLVRRLLTNMITDTRAARLLCYRAGTLRANGSSAAVVETQIAKYFASKAAHRAADSAVQLHGALGLSHQSPVGRYLRDARVLEIIEGSTQIQQISIPNSPLEDL